VKRKGDPVYVVDTPVHDAFGLTYSAYFCVPRLALQSMPVEWQRQFVALVEQLPDTPTYSVHLRDKRGRFLEDPLADYRRGDFAELTRSPDHARPTE
jgi:hypothetical protein